MDPSIVDLVHAKTKQANYTVKLRHSETTATCAAETEPLAIGFSESHFHHMFSMLPQPDSQSIILGHDFMRSKDHDITRCQHQCLVKAVKEHIRKRILKAIKKYLQENEALLTGPSCILPEAVLHLDTGDHPPVFCHQYPIPHHLMLVIDLQVAEWLRTGVIVLAPPNSPWNSPLTIIPKKDADGDVTQWPVCIDPCLLNKLLLDLTYPIPTIRSIISKVQGFFIAFALDLIWSYTQCPIAPEDCVKTTFTWNGCCYMFVATIFGIKIVAQHFQCLMDVVTAAIALFKIISDCAPSNLNC